MNESSRPLHESTYEFEGQGSITAYKPSIQMEFEEMKVLEKTMTQDQSDLFIFRAPTLDDVEATFELIESCSKHMIGNSETSLSWIRSEWTMPGFDLEKSTRIVQSPSREIIGYIEVWDVDDPPVSIWVWGRVHPEYENQGIGTRLMEWAENRARQAISRAPQDARVAMRSGSYSQYEPSHQLLVARDMTPLRHFLTMAIELKQELDEPAWPDGTHIRTMNGEAELRSVIQTIRDAFKDHWGFVEQPFEQEYEQWLHFIRHDEMFDTKLWFMAMDGDEIAGISLCRSESDEDPDMGWVNVLGVRRPWRRQGLGLALLQHSFKELQLRGKVRVGLGVDASSLTGATGLYEKAGMRQIRQFDTYEKELRAGRDLTNQEL